MRVRVAVIALFMTWMVVPGGVASGAPGEWVALFDGETLNGWRASENPASVKVENGAIVCGGPRSHLFYAGEVNGGVFKNFALRAEVMATPGANSGIYFHTQYQERGWPDKGYEVQINNTHLGEGGYLERKKTGSLYGVRNIYMPIVNDNEWFSIWIEVRGKQIRVFVNEVMTVDYAEPENPVRNANGAGRVLSGGTFAIQCHDPESRVYFKNIRVKPLPDDATAEPAEPPAVDGVYRQIVQLHNGNIPVVDFHTHLKGGLTLEDVLDRTRRDGINAGIAVNCGLGFPVTNDEAAIAFLESIPKGLPLFVAMQAEGREWMDLFSPETVDRFDYVFSDALTFTDGEGRRTRLWIDDEVYIDDPQQFMDLYVDRIVGILENEPIDIFVNPTFLPNALAGRYDELWTEARMARVIGAAADHGVAIEINARYRIPSAAFIKRAKEAGVKFAFGTNNGGADDLGRLEYCLDMLRECKLTAEDLFMPEGVY